MSTRIAVDTLARNLAEAIDDLYRKQAPPRDHDRMIELVTVQVRRGIVLGMAASRDQERFSQGRATADTETNSA